MRWQQQQPVSLSLDRKKNGVRKGQVVNPRPHILMLKPLTLTSITPDDEALRAPVREFLSEYLANMPPHHRARSWLGFDADFSRALGRKGWVGLMLPVAYGGGGRSHFARFVLVEELLNWGAPVAAHWIAERQSAPIILRFGSEEQRRRIVPAICRGEAVFCAGLSEPDSGSDLASIRSKAQRTDAGWRLSGTKLWTTNGHRADYMIGLFRSSGAPRDRSAGLSQFLINMKTPGITARPIKDLAGDDHFSEVHFDNVELPHDSLLGAEGAGWEQVNVELAYERSGPERILSSMVLVNEWLAFLRRRGSASLKDRELVGRLTARLAALRNLSLAVTSRLMGPESPVIEASMVKDLGTAFEQSIPVLISDHLAGEPSSTIPATLLATLEYVAGMSPSFSLRGGTREILRGIIARGLGLR
jgi:alkylation response protein AidB-like acyl-CoA dehydrogenase